MAIDGPRRLGTRLLFLLVACMTPPSAIAGEELTLTQSELEKWARFYEEHRTHKLMVALSGKYRPADRANTMALIDVNVIPMTGDEVRERYSVITRNGKIEDIGPSSRTEIPGHAGIVVAGGHYLVPGLTEAHAHTQISLSQYLVYLTRGVTTVREMDGFPWMLKARAMAADNALLIPSLYVAGHILSHHASPFYMTQVDSVAEVRAAVHAQAQEGYDFIKIHNSMPEPLFSAVFDAAREAGLDVVGHIPNGITIAHAIELGMRTAEHFKGYIDDEHLTITDQIYVAATRGSELWNAPTFTTYHDHLRGKAAEVVANEEASLRLVPRWMRSEWRRQANEPLDGLTELRQTIYAKEREIFKNLWPVTHRFLAGTDTGGYAYMVPGYTLKEEVRIFESLGLSPYEALKTATVNSAMALRKESIFGTLEVGKRADLVLLAANPLVGTANLSSVEGVMVRGIWLDTEDLREIAEALERSFSDAAPIPDPSAQEFEQWVAEMESLHARGFPYPDYLLEEIERFLEALHFDALAGRVDAMQSRPGVPVETP